MGHNETSMSAFCWISRSWPFRNINEMEMNLGGIKMNVLSKLLQGVKNLESFSFTSSSATIFDFPRLNRALLRCSRASLQKLILHDDTESQHYLGRLINFQLIQYSASGILLSLTKSKTSSIRSLSVVRGSSGSESR